MKWQEYQDAVGELYAQMEQIGEIKKNITIPDKVTGQPRQIDVWWEINGKGHKLGILIDAKMRAAPLDVKDIEEVLALSNAVGANLSIIVTTSGWTEPAAKRAEFQGMDLRLLSIEKALEVVVADFWKLCPICEQDCIIMDSYGLLAFSDYTTTIIFGGRCRSCKTVNVECQECGWEKIMQIGEQGNCECGYFWGNDNDGLWVKVGPGGSRNYF